MPAKLNLPKLSDLSDDPDVRYSELENHVLQLERRLSHRLTKLERPIRMIREQEELILKQEGIDYEYFSNYENVEPSKPGGGIVDTLSGHVVLYDVDHASFKLLSIKIKEELGLREKNIRDKLEPIKKINAVYQEFMTDFAVRYATLVSVGGENPSMPLSLVYCVGNNDMVMYVRVDMREESSTPIQEEKGTLDEYLSKEKQDELLQDHVLCAHNHYLITHPSDIFDHHRLSIASFAIMQNRFYKANPDAEAEARLKEEVAKAQGIGSIFSAIGRATRDPLGIGGTDDDGGMLN